jgi:multiple sugar transport system substrate-binding protein
MPGYVYNPALFEEYGIAQPEDGWTYEDLQRIGEEFAAATDGEIRVTADYSGGQLQPNFAYYVRQNGYDLFTEEGTIGFEANVLADWWSMWNEWREAELIPDAALSSELANATLEENFFATGRTAMVQVPANQLHLYQDLFEDELEIISMPNLAGGEPGEIIEGAYLTISESSSHPEEAARFIDFFVNSQESLEVFLVEQGAPGNSEMSEFVQEHLDEANTKAVEFVNRIVPEAEEAPFAPEGISELENIFGEYAEAVAFGNTTPEEAANQFMIQAEELGFLE